MIVLKFQDPNDPKVFQYELVETELSEDDLQNIVNNLVSEFNSRDIDWSYDDILDTLEEMGVVKSVDHKYYVIFA